MCLQPTETQPIEKYFAKKMKKNFVNPKKRCIFATFKILKRHRLTAVD